MLRTKLLLSAQSLLVSQVSSGSIPFVRVPPPSLSPRTFPRDPDTHPAPSRRWKARSRNLVNELAGLDSDVLALQEVDQYEEFWQPWLVERGYDGVYKCRTQLTKSKRDGCGLFFKRDKFELLARRDIEYNDIAWGRPVGYVHPEGSPEPTEAPVDADGGVNKYIRDCVGVLALLRSKTATDGYVMVASTHLYWDPAHADVKLAQARRLLGEVELFLASNSPIGSVPVVTAGDFNSVPGSEVHSAMLGGFGGRRLRSAYAAAIGEGLVRGADGGSESSVAVGKHGEPAHTNVTPGFTDCIDYVFVDENVAVRSAMPLPGRDEVATGLPDATRGSDHLPLTVDLELWSR